MSSYLRQLLRQARILPTLALHNAEETRRVGDVLRASAIPSLEVLKRTSFTWQAVAILRQEYPELQVGVGTLLSLQDLRQAQAAGAAFGVSPGLDLHLVQHAQQINFPYLPGLSTPSELMQLQGVGGTLVKFFPAGALGAIYLKQMAAPFPGIEFVASGGIDQGNWRDFLSLPQVVCVSGSWLLPQPLPEDIRELVAALRTARA